MKTRKMKYAALLSWPPARCAPRSRFVKSACPFSPGLGQSVSKPCSLAKKRVLAEPESRLLRYASGRSLTHLLPPMHLSVASSFSAVIQGSSRDQRICLLSLQGSLGGGSQGGLLVEDIQRSLIQPTSSLFADSEAFSQIDVELFHHADTGNDPRPGNLRHQCPFGQKVTRPIRFVPRRISREITFYTLSKRVPSSYAGDPADELAISRYLLEDHLAFSGISDASFGWFDNNRDFCHWYSFEVPSSTSEFSIKGVCVVDLKQGAFDDHVALLPSDTLHFSHAKCRVVDTALNNANIRVLISFREDAPPVAETLVSGVSAISESWER